MDPDTELEERFGRAKNILNYVNRPIVFLGLWPVNVTRKSRIKLVCYIMCHGFHVIMEITDLIMVFGNLQNVMNNLMVTCFQSMLAFRVLNVRFHPGFRQVINEMNDFHFTHKFDNNEEKKIYIEHIEKVERFHRLMLIVAWACVIIWYTTPILLHLSTRGNPNNTIPLVDPFRMPSFFNMSNIYVAILVYILEMPLLLSSTWYLAVYSLHFAFINGICGRLALLTHKIKNTSSKEFVSMPHFFRPIVEEHIKTIRLAKTLDDSACILLLVELFNVPLRMIIIIWSIITSIDTSAIIFTNYCIYLCLVLLCMYGNCYMGEYLLFESVNLSNAYGASNWYEMPQSYQKAYLICMARAQTPLQMTAGKFYVYTLNGFAGILKTCMAYVSVLRTLI